MKRAFVAALALLGVLSWGVPAYAHGTEKISSFDTTLRINADASVDVSEKIVYDFGFEDDDHHGIFRDIPVRYHTDLGTRTITLSNIHVVDETGTAYPFTTSRKGNSEEIKIGDPNQTVRGEKIYTISYRVERAMNYFGAYDELYWNVTGNDWDVPIEHSSVSVSIPSGRFVQVACYQGMLGSRERCSQDLSLNSSTTVRFAGRPLAASEGLTVAVGISKGVVYEPGVWENFLAAC
jgi:hypothetical protein